MDLITQTEQGVILAVKVRTGTGGFSVNLEKDGIAIRTKSPPEGGKANQEIVKGLMKILRRDVRIVRGLQSRHKEIFVDGASVQEIQALLSMSR
jgi:uncharacterized protein (TIGR00251 family)